MNSSDFDTGPLSWVKSEIDLALEQASAALAAYAQTPDDKTLGKARDLLHQAHGALTIVGVDGITEFSDAIEQLLAALAEGKAPAVPAALDAAQQGMSALRAHLDGLMAGQANQPLRLYEVYRAVVTAAGKPAPDPAELFFPDLTQRPPKRDSEPKPLDPAALLARIKAARMGFERGLLKWIKGDAKGIGEMKASIAMIEFTRSQPAARAYWWAALGVLEALAGDLLPDAAQAKRFAMRLGARVKKLSEGDNEVPPAFLREALYLVATATGGGKQIDIVRHAYRLAGLLPDEASDLAARRVPLLRRLRELLPQAKDHWNRLCEGTVAALVGFHEQASAIAEAGAATEQRDYARLVGAIGEQADRLRRDPSRHTEVLGLEIATALLLAETALDHFSELDTDFGTQVDTILRRLDAAAAGETLDTLEMPHLDAMSRRAEERQLMESIAREIAANLGTIEQTLDAYFRDPGRHATLAALKAPIRQVEGAFAVLGQERANAVLHECELAIADLAESGGEPDQAAFEELAHKLSALGFFVEQMQHGSADIDAFLQPAADEIEVEAPEPPLPTAVEEAASTPPPVELELPEEVPAPPVVAPPTPAPSDAAARLVEASSAEVDAELLGIFLEEAHEVLAAIDAQVPQLHQAPSDNACLTELRRSFHTLKGSGRMVGLTELGEAAWAVEQTLNLWLHEARAASAELLAMLDAAHTLFADWVAQLDAGGAVSHDAGTVVAACAALRGEPEPAPAPAAPVEAAAPDEIVPPVVSEESIAAETATEEAAPTLPEPEPELEPEPEPAAPAAADVLAFPAPPPVRVGHIEVAPTLYKLYLDETREHIATLQAQLGSDGVPGAEVIRAAHTAASISAATGFDAIHVLARALEHALDRLAQTRCAPTEAQRFILARTAGALEGMLGAVAERRLPSDEAALAQELNALQPQPEEAAAPPPSEPAAAAVIATEEAATTAAAPAEPELTQLEVERRARRIEDELDPQLLPLFLEESIELLAEIGESLRGWRAAPEEAAHPRQLQRALHTLKGSARMAGAMGIGELLHAMESRVEQALALPSLHATAFDDLDNAYDRAANLIEQIRHPQAATTEAIVAAPVEAHKPEIVGHGAGAQAQLRVRADLVDTLVNEAGEIAIARSRIEGEMHGFKSSLLELTENIIRLRNQVREIEIQAESQLQSQQVHNPEQVAVFDPLEFDRFTRFQELTRMLAESVNDVATVQHSLLRNLQHADAALTAQARLNRELSQHLMSVRMVPFDSLAERLHRVVRQAAKETERRANLDIRSGQTELDRSVIDRIAGSLEHLLRNAVVHGIGDPATREAAGKSQIGQITVSLAQEGNEVVVAIADDGNGLDLAGIRARALEQGRFAAGHEPSEAELTALIFEPGFSTATALTELAGRGVGMDVVNSETTALGGRIEVHSVPGVGATFRIFLPLTLALTQGVLVVCNGQRYAIPASMVEQVSELKPEVIAEIRRAGGTEWLGRRYPWHTLAALLGEAGTTPLAQRRHWLLLVKGGTERLALEVDDLAGNQEIVVKPVGPQLARVPGLAGATVLGNGDIALILNPIALAARAAKVSAGETVSEAVAAPVAQPPQVMVVDDSLTVRKITGRLLARHGYAVVTAKDGVDALELLSEALPNVMLVDIEMPRMDGFELARAIRADARLRAIPIIMITSRTADKHRDYAQQIGVDHYLGKPYDEDHLLGLVAGYCTQERTH